MIHIYKSVARQLAKNKLNSLIKILGISISLLVLVFVYVFVNHENSYDKHISESETIHRVIRDWQSSGIYSPSTPVPLLHEMITGLPGIETGSRLHPLKDKVVKVANDIFHEDAIYGVDSTFFETFNQLLKSGNPVDALNHPGSVVMSQSKSKQYFGDTDPIGKTIEFEGYGFDIQNNTFTVTGIYQDYPINAHFRPDFLLTLKSFSIYNQPNHNNHSIITYVKIGKGGSKEAIEKKLPDFMRSFYGEEYYEFAASTYLLEPIRDIHLNTEVYPYGYETEKGDTKTILLFPILGILILLIAGINYLNLIVAEGQKKRKAFGVEKINGAGRFFLLKYFLAESSIVLGLAVLCAMVGSVILLPYFNELMGRQLTFAVFAGKSSLAVVAPIIFIMLVGVAIPTYFFSGKKAIDLVSGKSPIRSSNPFRQVSQTLQFAICIFFLTGSFLTYKQMNYIEEKTNSSMNTDNVLVVYNARYLDNQRNAFKQRLFEVPGVQSVSLCNDIPGNGEFSNWGHPIDSALKSVHVTVLECDPDYAKTLGISMVKGRFFNPDFSKDRDAIVLNETVAKELGWQDDPIGKRYRVGKNFTVIGVAKDIHYEPLQYPITPQAFIPNRHETSSSKVIAKLNTSGLDATISTIRSIWKEFVPDRDMYYGFLDHEFEQWYKTEHRTFKLATILSGIAMFLAILGLLAAILDKIQSKIKEIGIRKVNGAKVVEVMTMLNKDFVKWVAIAFVIATPITWYAMDKWLQNFAYKTELSWWIFALAGVLALGIALLTVSWQSWRAATRNPVEALRYE